MSGPGLTGERIGDVINCNDGGVDVERFIVTSDQKGERALKFSDIQVSDKPLVLATPSEVAALESELWITFPDGYRDYVTTLGEGVLGGSFVRIYPPWRIAKERVTWRRRINRYWLWNQSRSVLPKDRALECIIIGDTLNGDELVFHPIRPNSLFVLPIDDELVYVPGATLPDAVEWMCSSGVLTRPFTERIFEPFDSRTWPEEAQPDPEGQSLDDIVDLGQEWAKRHLSRELVKPHLEERGGEGTKITLHYEAIVNRYEDPQDPEYRAVYRIVDLKTGLEVGVLNWHQTDSSYGVQYEPNDANLAKMGKSD